jgi:hypothetical protein
MVAGTTAMTDRSVSIGRIGRSRLLDTRVAR